MARRYFSTAIAVVISFGVLTLWAATPFVMSHYYSEMEQQGQAGDLFGSINALFSGLAFTGVIIAIFLQKEELALQRQEIAHNRLELARSAAAQEESSKALKTTIIASSYKTALDILQDERVRIARRRVLRELAPKPFEEWSEDDRGAAEIVCSTYDTVGIMTKYNVLPVEYIADSWGHSLRASWKTLEPLVRKYRRDWDAE